MNRSIPAFLVFLLLLSVLPPPVSQAETPDTCTLIHLQTSSPHKLASFLLMNGYDVLDSTLTNDGFNLITTPSELSTLQSEGYQITILDYGKPLQEINKDVPLGYPSLSEIYEAMQDAADAYPNICEMIDLTNEYETPETYEGRHIYALKISDNVSTEEDEPSILAVSNHHAREIITPVIALYMIEQLLTNYGEQTSITQIIDENELFICPTWNPDGYNYVYTVDHYWRKNRHEFPEYGTVGVDLNRNYPFNWDGSCSGSSTPTSQTYKGPFAASEAEIQTMIAFASDQHFAKVLDYHSYGQQVLYGYSCSYHPLMNYFQECAIQQASIAGYTTRLPSAEGEHFEWEIATQGSFSFLIETGIIFAPEYNMAIDEAGTAYSSALYLFQIPIPVSGHILDSVTGEPVAATIAIKNLNYQNNEIHYSDSIHGRYHLFLPEGDYQLYIQAEDYQTENLMIHADPDGTIQDIEIDRYNSPPLTPNIAGPTILYKNVMYQYGVNSTDPDNDDLFYQIDWGDQNSTDWMGPYPSGSTAVFSHQWADRGDYQVRVKTKDSYHSQSTWSQPYQVEVDKPILEILEIQGGLLRAKTIIENQGTGDASPVEYDIQVEGGLILMGKETTGSVSCLPIGNQTTLHTKPVLGFGSLKVTVEISTPDEPSASYTRWGVIYLLYLHLPSS